MQIWFLISEEARRKLLALMPAGWEPPKTDGQNIRFHCRLENLEEIGWLMKKPTRWGQLHK